MSLAARFKRLFAGSKAQYGIYRVDPETRPNGQGKIEGQSKTLHGEAEEGLWSDHLDGVLSLGANPDDNGRVLWGAINVDVYPVSLTKLAKQVYDARLPLTVVRSKSGGAHLFLFLASSLQRGVVTKKLVEFAEYLNVSPDVFPDDEDRWLILPYGPGSYAVDDDGAALTAEEFVKRAENMAMTWDTLNESRTFGKQVNEAAGPVRPIVEELDLNDRLGVFRDGPPCLIDVIERDSFNGSTSAFIFDLAVFAKTKYGEDEAFDRALEWSREFVKLPERDARPSIRAALKRDYLPRCKEAPIHAVCRYTLCSERTYGIKEMIQRKGGNSDGVIEFSALKLKNMRRIDSEPVIWRWTIEIDDKKMGVIERDIEVTSIELRNQDAVLSKILDVTSKIVKKTPSKKWMELIAQHTHDAEVIEVPLDATKTGEILHWVEKFCTEKSVARDLDELAAGRIVTTDGRTYFQSPDLLNSIKNQRVDGVTMRLLWRVLEGEREAEAGTIPIKGKRVSYWSIKAFPEQTEEFNVPRVGEDDESPF